MGNLIAPPAPAPVPHAQYDQVARKQREIDELIDDQRKMKRQLEDLEEQRNKQQKVAPPTNQQQQKAASPPSSPTNQRQQQQNNVLKKQFEDLQRKIVECQRQKDAMTKQSQQKSTSTPKVANAKSPAAPTPAVKKKGPVPRCDDYITHAIRTNTRTVNEQQLNSFIRWHADTNNPACQRDPVVWAPNVYRRRYGFQSVRSNFDLWKAYMLIYRNQGYSMSVIPPMRSHTARIVFNKNRCLAHGDKSPDRIDITLALATLNAIPAKDRPKSLQILYIYANDPPKNKVLVRKGGWSIELVQVLADALKNKRAFDTKVPPAAALTSTPLWWRLKPSNVYLDTSQAVKHKSFGTIAYGFNEQPIVALQNDKDFVTKNTAHLTPIKDKMKVELYHSPGCITNWEIHATIILVIIAAALVYMFWKNLHNSGYSRTY